jgi:elongation factor Ts
MVEGRVDKYYKEICLLEQPFVKDPDKTIQQLLTEKIAVIGENISIRRFARFERGEGIQKKEENFADEVMKQIGQ